MIGELWAWYAGYLRDRSRKAGAIGAVAGVAGLGNDLANPFTNWSGTLALVALAAALVVIAMVLLTRTPPPGEPYHRDGVGDALSLALFCGLVFGSIFVFQKLSDTSSATMAAADRLGLIDSKLEEANTRLQSIEQILSSDQPVKNPKTELEFFSNALIYQNRNNVPLAFRNAEELVKRFTPVRYESAITFLELGKQQNGRTATIRQLRDFAAARKQPLLDFIALQEEQGKEAGALPAIEDWITRHPDEKTSPLLFLKDYSGHYLKGASTDIPPRVAAILERARESIQTMPLAALFFQPERAKFFEYLIEDSGRTLARNLEDTRKYKEAQAQRELEEKDRIEKEKRENEQRAAIEAKDAAERMNPPRCTFRRFDQRSGVVSCDTKGLVSNQTRLNSDPWVVHDSGGKIWNGIDTTVSGIGRAFTFDLIWVHRSGSRHGPFRYRFQ